MRNCNICGRPLEENDEELCPACKNPNERTGIKIRPTVIICISLFLILIVLFYLISITNNPILLLWVSLPLIIVTGIISIYELKYYNSGLSKHILISDEYYKISVIGTMIVTLLMVGLIIFGLIKFYSIL